MLVVLRLFFDGVRENDDGDLGGIRNVMVGFSDDI